MSTFFASSVSAPSCTSRRTSRCTSRRTPKVPNSRRWKDDWRGTAISARATAPTIRPPVASWRAGMLLLSRHHRAYPRHYRPAAESPVEKRNKPPQPHSRRLLCRGLRDYNSALKSLPGACTDHIAVSELSANPLVADILERINEITRRDMLDRRSAGLILEGVVSG